MSMVLDAASRTAIIKNSWNQACQEHQQQWLRYSAQHSHQTLAGVWRILQHPSELMPWQSPLIRHPQPHDEPPAEEVQRNHYFSSSRFYCVETICAPCGLWLPGLNLQNQNLQQIFCNFWNQSTQQRYRDQIMCALTRVVQCFAPVLPMGVGTGGNSPLDL